MASFPALVFDMKTNRISLELLAQGWTKDQTPEGFRPWNDFYGGWEYKQSTYRKFIFVTPCGLITKGDHIITNMGYMGVNWMVENDNAVINCPFYSLRNCPIRHPLLSCKSLYNTVSGIGNFKLCAICRTDHPWEYANSVEKVLDDNEAEEDILWNAFSQRHHGRVCKYQSHFNRSEKKWYIHYNPIRCAELCCSYCSILQKPVVPKKANVYYDLKRTLTEPGEGFVPEETKVSVTKGIKLLRASETICEAVVQVCRAEIQRKAELNNHSFCFFGGTVEVLNLRVDRRPTKDLLQDLQDVTNGISVVHQSDVDKAKKADKHERRIASQKRRVERFQKMIRTSGVDALSAADQRRAEKHLSKEQILQAEQEHCNLLLPPPRDPQISLFEEVDDT